VNSLVCVLVLYPEPVVDSFLPNSFVIEPAEERQREKTINATSILSFPKLCLLHQTGETLLNAH